MVTIVCVDDVAQHANTMLTLFGNMVKRKLTAAKLDTARELMRRGASLRSAASELGVTAAGLHGALARAKDELSEEDRAIIVAVADASIPSGLARIAKLLGRPLLEVVAVAAAARPPELSAPADEDMAPDGEGGTGQFDDVDVHLILGADSVDSDRVMDRLAYYMQCERSELDEVVAEEADENG